MRICEGEITLKKFLLEIEITAEDETNIDDLVLFDHEVIEGFELTLKNTIPENEFLLLNAKIINRKEVTNG